MNAHDPCLSERENSRDKRWPVVATPVLTPSERKVWLEVQASLDHRRYLVVAATPLWALANYDSRVSERIKELWQTHVVSSAILQLPTRALRLAVLPATSEVDLRRALQTAGVPFIVSGDGPPGDIVEAILSNLRRDSSQVTTKSVGSKSQGLLGDHFRHAARVLPAERTTRVADIAEQEAEQKLAEFAYRFLLDNSWILLEEVALQKIVRFTDEYSWRIKGFYSRTSLDMLLVNSKDCRPLIAVEFDGPWHDSGQQQQKDHWKTLLLRDADVRLLRVSWRQVNLVDWKAASSDDRHAMASFLGCAKDLLLEIAQVRQQHWRSHDALVDEWRKRDEIAIRKYNRPYFDLTDEESDQVAFDDGVIDLRVEGQILRDETERELAMRIEEGRLKSLLQQLNVDADRVHSFSFSIQNKQDLWIARARAFVKDAGEEPVETPKIELRWSGVDTDRLRLSMKLLLNRMLAEGIAKVLG